MRINPHAIYLLNHIPAPVLSLSYLDGKENIYQQSALLLQFDPSNLNSLNADRET